MRLYELFKDERIKCANLDLNKEFNSIESDSRLIRENDVFVAIKGEKRNGNDYIGEALSNGAIAIVTDTQECYDNVPKIVVENTRRALAKMWNNYYSSPTNEMKVIAITGTNGKTSSAYILYSIIKSSQKSCGIISTVECLINGEKYDINGGSETSDIPSAMTTPDPKILYKLFYEMKERGVEYVIMEASSHSLSQFKLAGANIHIGVFTNLSNEHLDYHKTVENYFQSKRKLFEISKIKVVNIDDEFGKRLKKEFTDSHTISLESCAEFSTENIRYTDTGCNFYIKNNNIKTEIESRLIGKYTPYNVITAVACANLLGIDEKSIKNGVLECSRINGRMERINENIYIDYAHTPEAVEKAILSLKDIYKDKKIIALFGCGGDRDKSKRAAMAKIVSLYASEAIITSDNSRGEDKYRIISEILLGINKDSIHYVIPDRQEAIKFAVRKLKKDEILLLLGKGHEKYEIDENGKHYFDERAIIEEALEDV